ncbi:hypothetical protein HanIR_Chr17g0854161 [Helianthus annuus]|nr:hypothetical protein HanIR_Chr17g0854161 [Helianthus annuus]
MLIAWHNKTLWLFHIYLLIQITIQESSFHIHLVNYKIVYCSQGNQQSNSGYSCYRSICIKVVNSFLLSKALDNQSGFKLFN